MHEHSTHLPAVDTAIWLFSYLLYGAGQWVPRWECTGHDWLLVLILCPASIWLAYEKFVYAWKCGLSATEVENDFAKKHYLCLRNVFFESALIYLMMNIVCWFTTPYVLLGILVWHNAFRARTLNKAKDELFHWQQAKYGNKPITLSNVQNEATQRRTLETLDEVTNHLNSMMEAR